MHLSCSSMELLSTPKTFFPETVKWNKGKPQDKENTP